MFVGNVLPVLPENIWFVRNEEGSAIQWMAVFAEYVRIPEQILQRMPDCLHRLPDSLSFQEGALLEPSANSYKTVIQEADLWREKQSPSSARTDRDVLCPISQNR